MLRYLHKSTTPQLQMDRYIGSKFRANAASSHCGTEVKSGFEEPEALLNHRPTNFRSLYNAFGYILTEERVIGAASTTDIDIQHFQSYLAKLGLNVEGDPQPSEEDDLRNRAVIADFDGGLRPTLYGVLAFGRIPQSYPQTRSFMVQCCAYAGNDRASDVLQVADITGRLDDQVQRAMGWFVGLGHTETYDGVIRTDRYLLPRPAIREALVNAVVHRDYSITGSKILLEVFSDRVNVTSPGALPNHMTVESVRAGAHPRTRNELMAYYMLTLGFMEQRGTRMASHAKAHARFQWD